MQVVLKFKITAVSVYSIVTINNPHDAFGLNIVCCCFEMSLEKNVDVDICLYENHNFLFYLTVAKKGGSYFMSITVMTVS